MQANKLVHVSFVPVFLSTPALPYFIFALHVSEHIHLRRKEHCTLRSPLLESSGRRAEDVKPILPVSALGEESPSARDHTRLTVLDIMREWEWKRKQDREKDSGYQKWKWRTGGEVWWNKNGKEKCENRGQAFKVPENVWERFVYIGKGWKDVGKNKGWAAQQQEKRKEDKVCVVRNERRWDRKGWKGNWKRS